MFNKLILMLATVTIFAATPSIAAPTGCLKTKFFGTYTRSGVTTNVPNDGDGTVTYLTTLELRADGTAARHDTSSLDFIVNTGSSSSAVGSWTCRADGKLVVTTLRALYAPIAAGTFPEAAPNADVRLDWHLRNTFLYSVDDANTLTQRQSRSRWYASTEDPTDPAGGVLGNLGTTESVFKRLAASDADLVP
jgi:hypothetical protein